MANASEDSNDVSGDASNVDDGNEVKEEKPDKQDKPKQKVELTDESMDLAKIKPKNKPVFDASEHKLDEPESGKVRIGDSDGAALLSDLGSKDKIGLIESSRLLYGRSFHSDGSIDLSFSSPIFELKEKVNWGNHFFHETQGKIEVSTSFSSVRENLVQSGYTAFEAAIGGAYSGPGASVDVQAGLKYNSSSTDTSDEKHESSVMIAQSYYPRCNVVLGPSCIRLTKQFEKDFENLYLKGDKDDKIKFHDTYGYWVDLSVQLGGKIYASKSVHLSQKYNQEREEQDFEATFKVEVSSIVGGVTAKGGVAMGSSKDSAKESVAKKSSLLLTNVGGINTKVNENFAEWIKSIETRCETWDVIKIFGDKSKSVLQLTDFMNEKLATKIKASDEYIAILKRLKGSKGPPAGHVLFDLTNDYTTTWNDSGEGYVREIDGKSNDINCNFKGAWSYLVATWDRDSSKENVNPVSNIKFISSEKRLPNKQDLTDNLARGADGSYRYLELERNGDEVITDVVLWRSEKAKDWPSKGWVHHTDDLNGGRGGDFLYLAFKKQKRV